MLRILDRYIFREIAQTWLGVTVVLLFILLTNQFARVLGEVAKGNLPRDAVFQVMGFTALQYMTVLVPVGLFLSIMLALGRFYRDSEMSAMVACRVGPGGIYRPVMWIMLPLVLGVGWLAVEIGPKAIVEVERIGMEARRQADLASIEPGRFTNGGNDSVVYAEKVLGPGLVEGVFVQRRNDEDQVEVVVARRGEQRDSDDPNTRYFVLHDGKRYFGKPGSTEFSVVEFAEYGIPYRLPGSEPQELKPRAKPTWQLLRSDDTRDIAELQFRIAVPIATLVLAILAVPLSRSQPRQGRYGKLAIGLLVFIIYFNMLSAGKAWLESGAIDPALGLWWAHGLMFGIAILLVALQNGVHRRIVRVAVG